MNNSEKNKRTDQPTPGKYKEAMDNKTEILKQSTDEETDINPISKGDKVQNADTGREDKAGLNIDSQTDISPEELDDLEKSATRMPNEDDELLEGDNLVDEDEDGTPLNEGDDPLGEDLDISPEDKDANEYDNITE